MKTDYIEHNSLELTEIREKIASTESSYSEYLNTSGHEGAGTEDDSTLIGKLKNRYNLILRASIVNAFKSGDKKAIVSLLDIENLKFFVQSEFPDDCPWHSYRTSDVAEVINDLYSPIKEYIPHLYKLLYEFCVGIAAINYEEDGWHLLYFIFYEDGNDRNDRNDLSIMIGGPPIKSPILNKECQKYNWIIPNELAEFYKIHNGFGNVSSYTNCFRFDGSNWDDNNLYSLNLLNPFVSDYPYEPFNTKEYSIDDSVGVDEDENLLVTEMNCNMLIFNKRSYKNKDGNIPSENLLCFMEANGDPVCFARRFAKQGACPVIQIYHDGPPSQLFPFFSFLDKELAFKWANKFQFY